tara:strand:- start:5333 stop:6919 length:1587 start_codon:yes stop_codon:yes gene_type:complete
MTIQDDLKEIQRQQLFGAAGSDVNQFPQLGGLSQAMQIVKSMRPQQEKVDPALLSFLFFSQLAQESSKPGSTLLGAAGSAVQSPAAYLIQREEQERKAREGDFSTAVQLANLMKPKPGSYADYKPTQDLWLEKGQYVSVKPADGRKPDYPKGKPINLNSAERAQFPQGSLLLYKETKEEPFKRTVYNKEGDKKTVYSKEDYTTSILQKGDEGYIEGKSGWNDWEPAPFRSFNIFSKDGMEQSITNIHQYDKFFKEDGTFEDKYFENWSLTKPAPEEKAEPRKFYQITDAEGKVERKFLTDAEVITKQSETGVSSIELAPSAKSPLDYLKAYRKNYTDDDAYKEYTDLLKNYEKIEAAYELAYKVDRPQVADLSMIFAYMKMLDPRSVVREGEQAQASGTGGALDTVKNIYNSLLGGGRLTDAQRKSFRDAAYRYYTKSAENLTLLNNRYNKELDEMDYQGQRVFIKEPKSFKGKLKVYGTFPKSNDAFRKQVKNMDSTELAFLLGVANISKEQKIIIQEEVNNRSRNL